MVTYPIRVQRSTYRGGNPRKREKAAEDSRLAAQLEHHINDQLKAQEDPIRVYSYHEIASQTGISEEDVRRLCFSIDCGHNGLTAIKSGMTLDEAMECQNRDSI